jgi:hypothetical protein
VQGLLKENSQLRSFVKHESASSLNRESSTIKEIGNSMYNRANTGEVVRGGTEIEDSPEIREYFLKNKKDIQQLALSEPRKRSNTKN